MSADTQDGFANAWLGNMNTYSEGQRVVGNFYYTNVEAFVQDNWRVSRRLTLDLGARLAHMTPFNDVDPQSNRRIYALPLRKCDARADLVPGLLDRHH